MEAPIINWPFSNAKAVRHSQLRFVLTVFILLSLSCKNNASAISAKHSNLIMIWIMLRYFLVVMAILYLFFKGFKILKKSSTAYLLILSLNILFGCVNIVLYFFGDLVLWWLRASLVNLELGLVMLLLAILCSKR